MLTAEALRAAVEGDGASRVLRLVPAFQGLPDTAHGGSVLAALDQVAGVADARRIEGHFLKRVPLDAPLQLRARPGPGGVDLELADDTAVLVRGRVRPADADGVEPAGPPDPRAPALPISRTCFACGTDNSLGLRAQLRADDVAVGGRWTPPPGFADGGSALPTVALTTLLDEAAFWLGALASGEAGMTTELRVTLHAAARGDAPITVAGARTATRPRADARYWDTALVARDADGRLIASATITFVAVRGTARRLINGLLAVNPPDLLRRVFPAYTPA